MLNREPRWPMFHRVWRRAELTDRMIIELGIDPLVAARIDKGEAYCEACDICLTCPAARACRSWLNVTDQPPCPPDFCPNADFFESCRVHQKEAH